MIADLEARIILLTDDLFYARASVARMTVDLEDANRRLDLQTAKANHFRTETEKLRATSDKSDDKPAERPTYETLERENAALRADKERLEWIETNARLTRKVGYLRWSFEGPECGTVRGSIDIARGKEAQP